MWESRRLFGEISKGLVGRVGSLLLAFHSFHSPGVSTALFFCLRFQVALTTDPVPVVGYCGPVSFFLLLFFSR
jgi:hypothetical protein